MFKKPLVIITDAVNDSIKIQTDMPNFSSTEIPTELKVSKSNEVFRMTKFICYLFKNIISYGSLENASSIQMRQYNPPLGVLRLFERMLRHTNSPLPVVILGLFYLQRLFAANTELSEIDPKRKILIYSVCSILAKKYTDDKKCRLATWAQIYGVSTEELVKEEIFVLSQIRYSLFVPLQEYAVFCKATQGLAKQWNQVANSPYISPAKSPSSPASMTPVTPSGNIPFYLQSIDTRITKRKLSTANDYMSLATPTTNHFPSYPHSIFHSANEPDEETSKTINCSQFKMNT